MVFLVGWSALTPLNLLECCDSLCPPECEDYYFARWSIVIALVHLSVMAFRSVMTPHVHLSVMAPLVQWSVR